MGVVRWFFAVVGHLREAQRGCSQPAAHELQVSSAEGDAEAEFPELPIK